MFTLSTNFKQFNFFKSSELPVTSVDVSVDFTMGGRPIAVPVRLKDSDSLDSLSPPLNKGLIGNKVHCLLTPQLLCINEQKTKKTYKLLPLKN